MNDFCDLLGTPDVPVAKITSVKVSFKVFTKVVQAGLAVLISYNKSKTTPTIYKKHSNLSIFVTYLLTDRWSSLFDFELHKGNMHVSY